MKCWITGLRKNVDSCLSSGKMIKIDKTKFRNGDYVIVFGKQRYIISFYKFVEICLSESTYCNGLSWSWRLFHLNHKAELDHPVNEPLLALAFGSIGNLMSIRVLRPANTKFNTAAHEYEMTINNDTLIQLCDETQDPQAAQLPKLTFNFVS